ncbi:hypothetical protein VTN49DRAFT_47 [Thermomyces lanuginosus]|uniref:uncharacterized protein n=1 Tax=Thermomyces lanuginosus TaxID=5541 RepID=UPI0037428B2A
MPSNRLSTPVLTVDAARIHEVDTANTQSLHGMWLVFSKCADYMEEGRRLENLTWRLWTRETFCVEPESSCDTSVLPLLRAEAGEVPPLSTSVESAASKDEAEGIESRIKPSKGPDAKPTIVDDGIWGGKEKHITSMDLERMVMTIKERKELAPLPPLEPAPSAPAVTDVITPRASSPTPARAPAQSAQYSSSLRPNPSTGSCSTTAPEGNDSDAGGPPTSDTSVSSSGVLPPKNAPLTKSPSIVRGFSPSQISSSYRSTTRGSTEQTSAASSQPQQKSATAKRKGGMFTLGGSSGDDESSFEDRMTAAQSHQRSYLTEGLVKPPTSNQTTPNKVALTKSPDDSRTPKPTKKADENEDAVETEEEEISESAIEDDDEDWEDSITESGQSSVDDKELFQRVDSRPNLVSRRSLLTMMMHQPARMNPVRSTPALQRSRQMPPNGPSDGSNANDDDDDESLTMRGPDVPRSKPIGMRPVPQASAAHSPRTTRRNMLATELTESLRKHLLWERQQKGTALHAFQRRHTTNDMANLKEYPGPKPSHAAPSTSKDPSKNSSWNAYNDYGPWEYHVKGW